MTVQLQEALDALRAFVRAAPSAIQLLKGIQAMGGNIESACCDDDRPVPVPNPPRGYLDYLENVQYNDLKGLRAAEKSYGDSWKRRGGVGAFMMLARKWDRIENAMTGRCVRPPEDPRSHAATAVSDYDIFERTLADGRAEGLIDDIRDLRRYLLLVEGELRARGLAADEVKK